MPEIPNDYVDHLCHTLPEYKAFWPNETLDPKRLFERHTAEEWLGAFSYLHAALDCAIPSLRRTEPLHHLLSPYQRGFLAVPSSTPEELFSPFHSLLALECAAAVSLPTDMDTVPQAALCSALQGGHLLFELLDNPRTAPPESMIEIITPMIERATLLEHPVRLFGRALDFWHSDHGSHGHPDLPNLRGVFDEGLRQHFGFGLKGWLAAGACAVATQQLRWDTKGPVPSQQISLPDESFTQAANTQLKLLMDSLSATTEDFCQRCSHQHRKAPLWDYPSLEPLLETPVIRASSTARSYWVLSPRVLARSVLEGPLRATDETDRQRGRKALGLIVQSRADSLIARVFPQYKRLADSSPASRAEGVIWSRDRAIVVECKAATTSPEFKFRPRSWEDIVEEIRRFKYLDKALQQIRITQEAVMRGDITGPNTSRPRVLGSIIVTLESLPIGFFGAPILSEFIPGTTQDSKGITILAPQVLPLRDLEQLPQWKHLPLVHILEEKQSDSSTQFESLITWIEASSRKPRSDGRGREIVNELKSLVEPCLTS